MAASRTRNKLGGYTEQTGLTTITARKQTTGSKVVLTAAKGNVKAGSEPGQLVFDNEAEIRRAIQVLKAFLPATGGFPLLLSDQEV